MNAQKAMTLEQRAEEILRLAHPRRSRPILGNTSEMDDWWTYDTDCDQIRDAIVTSMRGAIKAALVRVQAATLEMLEGDACAGGHENFGCPNHEEFAEALR